MPPCTLHKVFFHECGHLRRRPHCRNLARLGTHPTSQQVYGGCDASCTVYEDRIQIEEQYPCPECTSGYTQPLQGWRLVSARIRNEGADRMTEIDHSREEIFEAAAVLMGMNWPPPIQPGETVFLAPLPHWPTLGCEAWKAQLEASRQYEEENNIPVAQREFWVGINDEGTLLRAPKPSELKADRNENCSICLTEPTDSPKIRMLPCGHLACGGELRTWFSGGKNYCAECKTSYNIHPVPVFGDGLDV